MTRPLSSLSALVLVALLGVTPALAFGGVPVFPGSGGGGGGGTITLTGPVTGTGTGTVATSVTPGALNLNVLANIGAGAFLGNNTGSIGPVLALTSTQATAMLNPATIALQGMLSALDKQLLTAEEHDWFRLGQYYIQAIDSTITTCALQSEMQDLIQFTVTTTSGTAGILSSSTGGVLDLGTGVGTGHIAKAVNLSSNPVISNVKTGHWSIRSRSKIIAGNNGGSSLYLLNMTDEATVDFGIFLGNTDYVCGTHDTGVAWATGTYHDYSMVANGTSVACAIDGVTIDTVAQSGAANAAGHVQILSQTISGAPNTEQYVDKVQVCTAGPQ